MQIWSDSSCHGPSQFRSLRTGEFEAGGAIAKLELIAVCLICNSISPYTIKHILAASSTRQVSINRLICNLLRFN